MPSREEKINIGYFLHGRGHLHIQPHFKNVSFPVFFLKRLTLLYTRKTYRLKEPSNLKVDPYNRQFQKDRPFYLFTLISPPTSKCCHLIPKLDLALLISLATQRTKCKSGSVVISLAAAHPITKRTQWAREGEPTQCLETSIKFLKKMTAFVEAES